MTNTALGDRVPVDGGDVGVWCPLYNTAIINGVSETVTKTVNQNFMDKILSRPMLKDTGETVYAHGNVSGAVTVNWANGNHQSMTLTGNVTLTLSSPTPTGNLGAYLLFITQDGTGGRTVTFPAACKNEAGTTFTISGTAANKMTEVGLYTLNEGTLYRTAQGRAWT